MVHLSLEGLVEARKEDAEQYATVQKGFDLAGVLQWLEWIATANVSWYVWYENGTPIGWATIRWDGRGRPPTPYPELSDLYVRYDRRSQGIGASIIRACEEIVRECGYTRMGIGVNPDLNQRAYWLYIHLGYVDIGTEPYLDGVYNGVEEWVVDLVKEL